ncbi:MAG: hypothetical protein ACI4SH_03530, partial [Candidatus Scatosoma sp.]
EEFFGTGKYAPQKGKKESKSLALTMSQGDSFAENSLMLYLRFTAARAAAGAVGRTHRGSHAT